MLENLAGKYSVVSSARILLMTTLFFVLFIMILTIPALSSEDIMPPVTTITIDGTAGYCGWYRSDMQLTLSASDDVSGVNTTLFNIDGTGWQTYESSFTFSVNGIHMIYFYSIDNAGNVESPAIRLIKLDSAAPVTVCKLYGNTDNEKWYSSNVTVELTAFETVSGVRSIEYSLNDGVSWNIYYGSISIASEGNNTVLYRSCDNAGNIDPTKPVYVQIDKTGPVTEAIVNGTQDSDGRYLSEATVTLSAYDAVSGIDFTEYSFDLGTWHPYSSPFNIISEGNTTVYYRSIDAAGNNETPGTLSICIVKPVIDDIAPVSEAIIDGAAGDNGWYVSDVALTVISSDDKSGVNRTQYSYDGSAWADYTGPILITADSLTTVYYHSMDNAGNVEAVKSIRAGIDRSAPVTACLFNGVKGNNDWYISDVQVTLSSLDGISGVSRIEYSVDSGDTWQAYASPFNITTRGVSKLFYRSIDMAGNQEGTKTINVKIDKQAPVTSYSITGKGNKKDRYDGHVMVMLSADDDLSGVNSIKYSLNNGTTWSRYNGPIMINHRGTTKLLYGSIDNAGNTERGNEVSILIGKA